MEKEAQPKLKSLGGWLVIYLLSTAWGVYSLFTALKDSWATYMSMGSTGALMLILFSITLIMGLVSMWLISEKKKIAVPVTMFYLWTSVAVSLAVFMMISSLVTSGYDYSPLVTAIIQTTVGAIIWTLYFKESKRVKETLID